MKERPEELPSTTIQVPTGLGKLYITITEMDNAPYEVFCTIGKSGGSVMAKAEEEGRMITLALKNEIPMEDIVKQLVDIHGQNAVPWKKTVIKSIPDAVGQVLKDRYVKVQVDNS